MEKRRRVILGRVGESSRGHNGRIKHSLRAGMTEGSVQYRARDGGREGGEGEREGGTHQSLTWFRPASISMMEVEKTVRTFNLSNLNTSPQHSHTTDGMC